MTKTKNIDEIKTNKGQIGVHTAFLAGDILHFRSRLESAREKNTMIAEDVRWHIVPIVSIFESFFKEVFAKYIDSGDPFLANAEKLTLENRFVSVNSLISVAKKSFSAGDIIAYALKYNSFNEIRRNYQAICGCDYMEKILSYDFKLGKNDLNEIARVKPKINNIFSNIARMFEMRHCLIHEYPANNVALSMEDAIELLDYSWLLLMTTDRMMWQDTGLKNPFPLDIYAHRM